MSGRLVLAEPALVGRENELQDLQSFLNSAVSGKGRTVFISGEAGSGKSRLAREFLGAATRKGVKVLTGWCLSNAAVPYFPFFEAFNAYFTGQLNGETEDAIDITGWLRGPSQPIEFGKLQGLSPQVWKDQTFAAVAKTLASISTLKPVILFLDDVHWADSASLALIHYLARAITSEKVLLMATFRSEQLAPDADGRPHPLVETLRQMRREELYNEIKVTSLGEICISDIAKSMLGGDVQQEFADKLAKESQGNPLFVVESLRMLHERKSLAMEHEKWRLASTELGIPEKIKDIILQRLDTLSPSQREMLDAASVIGEEFDVNLLASVLGKGTLETAKALDTVAKNTSLVSCKGEMYRFDHARSRDAIYEEVSPALKRAYHSKVAERLETTSKDGKQPLSELSYHYSQAGSIEKAVKYAIAAGHDAVARWSNAQAIEHFTYALQNLPEDRDEQRRVALEGLGDAYAANNMYREAAKTFDKLAALETGRQRLRAIRKAMDATYFMWGSSNQLLEYARKAEELGVDDRLEMARILVNRGRAFGFAADGNSKMDLADSDSALQVFEEEYSLADVATALWRSGILCTLLEGLQEKGLSELLRSVSIFKELGDVRREVETTYWTGAGFQRCFLQSEARHAFETVLSMGEKLGMFAELSMASIALGILDEYYGNLAEAITDNLKSSEYGKKTDALSGVDMAVGHLLRVYSKLGDPEHADEFFEKVGGISQEKRASSHYLIAPDIAMTRGVRLAAKGQWDESNETFKKLSELSKTIGFSRPFWRARVCIDYAWALEKQGRFEEARVYREEARKIKAEVEARFEHSNPQVHLMARRRSVVGDEFEVRFDLVNVGRKQCTLVKIAGSLPPEFKVTSLPSFCGQRDDCITLGDKIVEPFAVETIKVGVSAVKTGCLNLAPDLFYIDDLGRMQTRKLNKVAIIVESAKPAFEVLPDRVSTGTEALDALLFGGLPKGYAVALVSPSSDERGTIIRHFIEEGAETGETTFYITADPNNAKDLAEKHPENFYLFICNSQADPTITTAPNIFKLKGVENLTEIDIALTKAFRTLSRPASNSRRICIEIVSDVLLQHHAVTARKWLTGILPTLKANNFTTLAVFDPQIHPSEELQAVLGVFDGEIRVTEKESPDGSKRLLKIRKLGNQRYFDKEKVLDRKSLDE